ncbi:MAG: hypothetical protein RLZZ104_59, partial [Pseudomonadota bacterium]
MINWARNGSRQCCAVSAAILFAALTLPHDMAKAAAVSTDDATLTQMAPPAPAYPAVRLLDTKTD